MKSKLLAILCILCCFSGCTQRETEHTTYFVSGTYYTSGQVITEDGNVWLYSQDIISETTSYDQQPIIALFGDNGTPDNIYDDEIYGLVHKGK